MHLRVGAIRRAFILHSTDMRLNRLRLLPSTCLALSLISGAVHAQDAVKRDKPFVIAPVVYGLSACEEGMADSSAKKMIQVQRICRDLKRDGSPLISRLLDTLEPGGPKGDIQVGYTLTLPLLSLYQKTDTGWMFDEESIDEFFRVVERVKRPVVLYFVADHFDSPHAPLPYYLDKEPRNLMQLSDGKPLKLGYFNANIFPWTLRTDPDIPVNRFRFEALDHVAKRVLSLSKEAQDRIVAITLAGELHQMFPNFESGMGSFDNVQYTDYSPASVADFRRFMQSKYQTLARLKSRSGMEFKSFDAIPAPARDANKEKLPSPAEHFDAYAGGTLPIAGWLWDPQNSIEKLELFIDGKREGAMPRGLNRLDVYRAVEDVTSPSTGYRYDFDYSRLLPGKHIAQVVATSKGKRHQIGETSFTIESLQEKTSFFSKLLRSRPSKLGGLEAAGALPGVKTYLDLPQLKNSLRYNPIARDWNEFRQQQVYNFLNTFHQRALKAGLPKDKLYSHQIVPNVNSSWNADFFAVDKTISGAAPWKHGLNMYGGATESPWLRGYLKERGIETDYGVPEFNPQQWKRPDAHTKAILFQYNAGARFISPYFFTVIPPRYLVEGENEVNRMTITPTNTKEGSDQFYRAIVELAPR